MRLYYLLSCVVSFQLVAFGGENNSQIVNSILSSRHNYMNSLLSLEYKSDLNSLKDPLIHQAFTYDHGMFMCNLYSPNSATHLQRTVAFNGKLYQELNLNESILSVTRNRPKSPYLSLEAICLSHIFAIPPNSGYDLSFNTFHDEHIWFELSKNTEFKELTRIGKHNCTVLKITWPTREGPVLYEVAFAKEYDWFPLRLEAIIDKKVASRAVTELTSVKDASGKEFYIPYQTKLSTFMPDGELTDETSIQVSKESIKVNHAVDKEIFTIPRTQANLFVDTDLGATTYLSADIVNTLALGAQANKSTTHDSRTPRSSDLDFAQGEADNLPGQQPSNYRKSLLWALLIICLISLFCVYKYVKIKESD